MDARRTAPIILGSMAAHSSLPRCPGRHPAADAGRSTDAVGPVGTAILDGLVVLRRARAPVPSCVGPIDP
ncbi:MAG: hypothetical protein V7646_4455 [Pseudonocardia sp.]